ncbi:MAG TPA: GNAT family N-acetyltransferase [Pirellulales bacterium]|jgi:ribosomal-protein-alanine N-acetyltransferase
MSNWEQIETDRLIAQKPTPDDFGLWQSLLQNVQVAKTLGDRTDDEVRQFLAGACEHWQKHGFGRWNWHLRGDGKFVGRGGLNRAFVAERDEIEVAYAIMPEFWNQGFATEIAKASIEVGFRQLGFSELVTFTLPTNLGSRRVMEKCGFKFEADIVWKDLPHVLYRLTR